MDPQFGLAEIFTVKMPRLPLPLFAPMVTVTDPLPLKLLGETESVRGFPLPAVVAEILWVPVAFVKVKDTVPVRWSVTL